MHLKETVARTGVYKVMLDIVNEMDDIHWIILYS